MSLGGRKLHILPRNRIYCSLPPLFLAGSSGGRDVAVGRGGECRYRGGGGHQEHFPHPRAVD